MGLLNMSTPAPTNTPASPPPQRASDTPVKREHVEGLLDDALAGTFPASDPVSTLVPEVEPTDDA